MVEAATTPEHIIVDALAAYLGPHEHPDDRKQDEAWAVRALAALRQAGFAVVPREATKAMIRAGDEAWCDGADVPATWLAMLEEAEKAQQP